MRNFQNDGWDFGFKALWSIGGVLAILLIFGVVPRGAAFDVTELLLLWPAAIIAVLRGWRVRAIATFCYSAIWLWLAWIALTQAH